MEQMTLRFWWGLTCLQNGAASGPVGWPMDQNHSTNEVPQASSFLGIECRVDSQNIN